LHIVNAWLVGGADLAHGRCVTARFEASRLHVDATEPDGISLIQDSATLVVSIGGLDAPQLSLNWLDDKGHQWSLCPAGADDTAILIAGAPPDLQPQLAPWHQRRRNARRASTRTWAMILALPSLCALLLLALWLGYPHATLWLTAQISVALEEKLGNAALGALRAEGDLIESGEAQQLVQRTGAQLTPASRYHYRWIIKQDASLNAFALPGGIVVVHTGLLKKMESTTELAGVLAHEVQHVEQRHGLRQMVSSAGLAGMLALTVGDVSSVAALLAHQLGSSYFGREIEEQADRLGFDALLHAGIRPEGMATLMRTLARSEQQQQTGTGTPAWLASHPETAQRVRQIEAMIAQQPCPQCRYLDGDWEALLAALASKKDAEQATDPIKAPIGQPDTARGRQ
jgi:Zn-dependent protease with chaperone function